MLFPSWLMVMNSFSPAKAFLRSPPRLLPYQWTLENYKRAFTVRQITGHTEVNYYLLPRWLANTAILLVVYVVGGVLINGAAGYVFCFAKARAFRWLFWVMMTPIFVSRFVLLIAQIMILGKLRISGLAAVFVMSMPWCTGIYLFRNYFRSIPLSIIESARIDGAGEWTVLTRIVLPVSKPIVGAAVVFLGMGALGDYVWQMLNLHRPEQMTYLVGLMATTLNVMAVKNIGYNLAVGTLLFLPYLALFAFSSKYFISGLTGGALNE